MGADPIRTGHADASSVHPDVDMTRLPRHVAVIMDGNGRWARGRGLPRIAGHRAGVHAVRDTIEASGELGIEVLTLYAFSRENWKRPAREIRALMRLLHNYLHAELDNLHQQNVRCRVIGRRDELPAFVRRDLELAETRTADNTGMQLVIALSYSGRTELADAARQLAHEAAAGQLNPNDIDEAMLQARMQTASLPEPDLLIRTSGEYRVSNFLLWQIAYTELYVTDVLWPDFRREQLYEAIASFQRRERRYGGVERAGVPAVPNAARLNS